MNQGHISGHSFCTVQMNQGKQSLAAGVVGKSIMFQKTPSHTPSASEAPWKCHQGWRSELQQDSSAGGVFNEIALRRSVNPRKVSIFLKKLKITPEVCNTDLITYKRFYCIFSYFCKNLPSKFCSSFIKMGGFGSALQNLWKWICEFLKAAVGHTCIFHSLEKHEHAWTVVMARDDNAWFGNRGVLLCSWKASIQFNPVSPNFVCCHLDISLLPGHKSVWALSWLTSWFTFAQDPKWVHRAVGQWIAPECYNVLERFCYWREEIYPRRNKVHKEYNKT